MGKKKSEASEEPTTGPLWWKLNPFDLHPPHRRLDCVRYGECLDHADREGWPSWRCPAGCAGYVMDLECLRQMSVNASLSGVDISDFSVNADSA
jgi:hypothetical protein